MAHGTQHQIDKDKLYWEGKQGMRQFIQDLVIETGCEIDELRKAWEDRDPFKAEEETKEAIIFSFKNNTHEKWMSKNWERLYRIKRGGNG